MLLEMIDFVESRRGGTWRISVDLKVPYEMRTDRWQFSYGNEILTRP